MVYARTIERKGKWQDLTFHVSGKLWQRSLVMRDTQTESLWSHILGKCMAGPLEGAVLEILPAEMVTWSDWKKRHPGTTVLALPRTDSSYHRDTYGEAQDWVFGVVIGNEAMAFPFDVLTKKRVIEAVIAGHAVVVTFDPRTTRATVFSRRRTPGKSKSRKFTFDVDKGTLIDRTTSSRWDPTSGQALEGPLKGKRLKVLPGIVSFRRAWEVFHPGSRYAK